MGMSLEMFLRWPALKGGQKNSAAEPWEWVWSSPGERIRLRGGSSGARDGSGQESPPQRSQKGADPGQGSAPGGCSLIGGCSRCREQLERWDGTSGAPGWNIWSAGMGLVWDFLAPPRLSCTVTGRSMGLFALYWHISLIPGSIPGSLGSPLPRQRPAPISNPHKIPNSCG